MSKLNLIKKEVQKNTLEIEEEDYRMYKNGTPSNLDLNDGAEEFINILKVFSNPKYTKALKAIYAEVNLAVSQEVDIYTLEEEKDDGSGGKKIIRKSDEIKRRISAVSDISNKNIQLVAQYESDTPYGIFYPILNGGFSDIIIHKGGIKVSDNIEFRDIQIPKVCMPVFKLALDHFTNLIKSTSKVKFGPGDGNSIVNAEMNVGDIGVVRYNMVHSSLNGRRGWPVVVLRKQTASSLELGDEYLESLGVTESQKDYIKKASMMGSTFIFGQVGSGKTTLMNYMASYKLEEKRNLITIEDTAELDIDVPLALTTNGGYDIKTLFTESLRQNFSGIVIGESRSDTIIDILEASLSADLAMSTLHATSLPKVIQRIVIMAMPRKIPREDVENLIKIAVTSFIYIDKRKIQGIWRNSEDLSKSVYEIFEEVK